MAMPALAGPVNWAHQAGAVQSNGAVIVKSLSGGSYAATSNPTGSMVRMHQNAATQPPTILVSGGLPCFLGMLKASRIKHCTIGGDVQAAADDPTVIGKYGGVVLVPLRSFDSSGWVPTSYFENDLIVAITDLPQPARWQCYYGANGLGKWNIPASLVEHPEMRENWVDSRFYGAQTSWEYMQERGSGACGANADNNGAVSACVNRGNGWYLPSTGELAALSNRRVAIGGFQNTKYWSGESNGQAFVYDFATNSIVMLARTQFAQVRCVRNFPTAIKLW